MKILVENLPNKYNQPGSDLGPIWQWSPLLGATKLAPKKNFSCGKQTCICHKKTLIYIKICQTYLKSLKEFHFKLFLTLALASGATKPRLGVSEHSPNLQFQGLKIHLFGYRRPNYFSRSSLPACAWKKETNTWFIKLAIFKNTWKRIKIITSEQK